MEIAEQKESHFEKTNQTFDLAHIFEVNVDSLRYERAAELPDGSGDESIVIETTKTTTTTSTTTTTTTTTATVSYTHLTLPTKA